LCIPLETAVPSNVDPKNNGPFEISRKPTENIIIGWICQFNRFERRGAWGKFKSVVNRLGFSSWNLDFDSYVGCVKCLIVEGDEKATRPVITR